MDVRRRGRIIVSSGYSRERHRVNSVRANRNANESMHSRAAPARFVPGSATTGEVVEAVAAEGGQ